MTFHGQYKNTENLLHTHYAEQKGEYVSIMKKNQTAFLKLCLSDALIKLMESQPYNAIKINAICERADIGRTTFYRYFDNKNNKEDLLIFKIIYEWECYCEKHEEAIKKDKGFELTNFIYENKKLFSLLYKQGLIVTIMQAFEKLISSGEVYDKNQSYLISFFIYGYFGIIYQWIKYDFDETPKQIQKHIKNTLLTGMTKNI